MDPCDLRLADGDAAVRELIGSRIPLYRFVLDNTLERYDLDRGDQRVDAVREAVRLTRADPRQVQGRGVPPRDRDRRSASTSTRSAPSTDARRSRPPSAPNQAVPPRARRRGVELRRAAVRRRARGAQGAHPVPAHRGRDTRTTSPTTTSCIRSRRSFGWPSRNSACREPPTLHGWLASRASSRRRTLAASCRWRPSSRCRPAKSRPSRVVAVTILQLQARTLVRRIADLKSKLPAHEPGRAGRRLQQHFGRADGLGAAAPVSARPRERPLIVHTGALVSRAPQLRFVPWSHGGCRWSLHPWTSSPCAACSRRRRCRASESGNSHARREPEAPRRAATSFG